MRSTAPRMLSMGALRRCFIGVLLGLADIMDARACACMLRHASACGRSTAKQQEDTSAAMHKAVQSLPRASASAGRARRAVYPPLDIAKRVVLVTGVGWSLGC